MPSVRSPTKRFLPHALVATFVVMILPALAVSFIDTSARPWLVVGTVLLAMGMSLAAASAGAAIWMRRPGSKDIVFGDLMLWGWLRRMRAERRLDQARAILGLGDAEGEDLSHDRRCEVLRQLSALLESRDAYTHGHTRRVTRHSERIAREMDLSPEEVAKVRTAAAIHDVGKVHTPRTILTKADKLTDEEYAAVKLHPVDGARMAADMGDPDVSAMVLHHHERLDGRGYPEGLSGEAIPLGARIIAVADTFDAMTSGRPYRPACKHKKALDVLSGEAGSQLDPVAVAAFLRYYSGKRSVAWSALVIDAPPRMVGWIGGLFQSVGGGAVPIGQAIGAVGATALVGASLAGNPPATAATDSADAGRQAPPAKTQKATGPVAHGPGGQGVAPRGRRQGSGPRERAAVRGVSPRRNRAGRRGPVAGRGLPRTRPRFDNPSSTPGTPPVVPAKGNDKPKNPPAKVPPAKEPKPTKPPKPEQPTPPPKAKEPKLNLPPVKPPKVKVPKVDLKQTLDKLPHGG